MLGCWPAESKGNIQTSRKIHCVRSPTHFLLRLWRFQIRRSLGGMRTRHLSSKFTDPQGGRGGDPKLHTHLLRKDLCTGLDVTFQPQCLLSVTLSSPQSKCFASLFLTDIVSEQQVSCIWLVISKNEITCQGHLLYSFTTTAELF